MSDTLFQRFPRATSFAIAQAYEEEGEWFVEGYPSSLEPNLDRFGPSDTVMVLDESAQQDLASWALRLPTVFRNHNLNEEVGAVKRAEVQDGRYWAKILITKTRPDIWQKIKEGVLTKFSVQFIPTETYLQPNAKLGKDEFRIKHLVGLETSLVGLPANDHVEMLRWYVAQGADQPSLAGAKFWQCFAPLVAPAFAADGRLTFSAQISCPDTDGAAQDLLGRVVVQGNTGQPGAVIGARVGHVTAAHARDGKLSLHASVDAHSPAASDLRLTGTARQNLRISGLRAEDGQSIAIGLLEICDCEDPQMTEQTLRNEIALRKTALSKATEAGDREALELEIADFEIRLKAIAQSADPAAEVEVPAVPAGQEPAEAPAADAPVADTEKPADSPADPPAEVEQPAQSDAPPASEAATEAEAPPAPPAPEAPSPDDGVVEQAVVPHHAYPIHKESKWSWTSAVQNKILDAGGWTLYRSAHAWYDEKSPEVKASYKLPHHTIVGGKLVTHWPGTAHAMAALLGARGGTSIPAGDRRGVYNHLAKHYKAFDKEPPEFKTQSWEQLQAFHAAQDIALEDEDTARQRAQDLLSELVTLFSNDTSSTTSNSVVIGELQTTAVVPQATELTAAVADVQRQLQSFEARLKDLETHLQGQVETALKTVADKVAEIEALPASGPNGSEAQAPVRQTKDRKSVWEEGPIIRALYRR